MEDNILILETAKSEIMDNVLSEFQDGNIYCAATKSFIYQYQARYPKIKFITINKKSFYDFSELDLNNLKDKNFHQIILPSSAERFHNFHFLFGLIKNISCSEVILFNSKGEMKIIKSNKAKARILRIYLAVLDKCTLR